MAEKDQSLKIAALIVGGLLAVMVVNALLGGPSERRGSESGVGIGSVAMLSADGGVPGCEYRHQLNNLVKASIAHDEVGIRELIVRGDCVLLTGGSLARVLEVGLDAKRVRLTGPPYQDQAFWVLTEHVKKYYGSGS